MPTSTQITHIFVWIQSWQEDGRCECVQSKRDCNIPIGATPLCGCQSRIEQGFAFCCTCCDTLSASLTGSCCTFAGSRVDSASLNQPADKIPVSQVPLFVDSLIPYTVPYTVHGRQTPSRAMHMCGFYNRNNNINDSDCMKNHAGITPHHTFSIYLLKALDGEMFGPHRLSALHTSLSSHQTEHRNDSMKNHAGITPDNIIPFNSLLPLMETCMVCKYGVYINIYQHFTPTCQQSNDMTLTWLPI